MELAAFFAVFVASGWRPGQEFPSGDVLLSASGAAFAAVVFGQSANAFACRSTTRWAGAVGWFSNRLLVAAVVIGAAVAALFVFVPPIADLLRQQPPPAVGWAIALTAIPAVLVADALQKRIAGRAQRRSVTAPSFGQP